MPSLLTHFILLQFGNEVGAGLHERPTNVYPATLEAVIREIIPGDMKAHADPSGLRVSFICCRLSKHISFQYANPSILVITSWIRLVDHVHKYCYTYKGQPPTVHTKSASLSSLDNLHAVYSLLYSFPVMGDYPYRPQLEQNGQHGKPSFPMRTRMFEKKVQQLGPNCKGLRSIETIYNIEIWHSFLLV